MSWDYIVVGAGSAGCATAWNLVRSGGKVLLIEAGGNNSGATIGLPFNILKALDTYDWGYLCEPDPTRQGRSEHWHQGKVLGGTSSVNGMIYVRGSHADYDLWASQADQSWSSANVMAFFREMERCDPASITSPPDQRGYAGQLRVRMVQNAHRTTRAFIDSMVEMGYPFNPDYNAASQEGVGFTQMTQYRGRRFSAYDAFVRPILGSPNLHVLKDCEVQRINIAEGRATGVTVRRRGATEMIEGGHVILSAGTINSPKLLMLSGIGDGDALRQHGIAVKVDRKAVGRGLVDHPIVRIAYDMRVPTYAFRYNPFQIGGLALKYLLSGQGLLGSPHEAMAFVRTRPDLVEPDLQLHFAPIGVNPIGEPPLMKTPSVFTSIKKNRPGSRGAVRLRSANAADAPIIEANLLEDPADTNDLVEGIKILRRIMDGSAMRPLVRQEVASSAHHVSDAELEQYVRANATIACHHVGTCGMGADPDQVTDPSLRVRGVDHLWIADASVMPFNVSGNTNASSMMIGFKLGKELGARS